MNLEKVSGGPPRILVVDDDYNIKETMKDILEEEGYIVETADSLSKAQEIIEKENFNVILSDLSLGEYSSLSLVELVRRKSPRTIFILITGQDKLDADLEATKNDVDEYILKPIQPNELIHKIKIHLEKQMLTKKLSQK